MPTMRVAMLVPLFCLCGSAAALAQQPAATPSAGAAERVAAEKLIAEARDLYYADKAADALADIAKAEEALERTPYVPLQDRVMVQLWLATIRLANSSELAESEAREAVALDPTRSVDLSIFPPAVAELVDKVKQSPPASHKLQLRGVPAGAHVYLDGRPILPGATVLEGRHWLDVDCAGYSHLIAAFDARGTEPVVVDAAPPPLPRPKPTPPPIVRTPVTRRPLFWGIVAAGAIAIAGGTAYALAPPATSSVDRTTGKVTFQP